MADSDRIVSILFSDLEGYSKVKDDTLKSRLVSILEDDVKNHILNPSNHFYYNTWGDAFFICSDNPAELADIALQMRDKVRNRNWKGLGYQDDIAIRIGLHIQRVKVSHNPDDTVKNVIGEGVDTTARIEPVTEPDQVFCSALFYQHLMTDENPKIKGLPVGKRQLAKSFGEMDLYRLLWSHEVAKHANSLPNIPLPKISQRPTDKQRNEFLYKAFDFIRSYLQNALVRLEAENPGIETSCREITSTKFVCEIYLRGESKSRCKIWIGGFFSRVDSIHYAGDNFDLNADNSWNESLQIDDDGSEIFLKPLMGMGFTVPKPPKDKLSPSDAAEYLWARFVHVLES